MAVANNITLDTNFNNDPWWDDFDETKRFHRILFKPSLAVQARELTQMQTILQNQVDRFAAHIFKDGSNVSGGAFGYDSRLFYVKLDDQNYLGNTVSVSNFAGTSVVGGTSGVEAIVIDVADGSEVAANTKTLFLKYVAGSPSNTESFQFIPGENITSNNGFLATILSGNTAVGIGTRFTIGEGIFYAKDHFIYHPEQSIILDRYSPTPSYHVGFTVDEDIVSYIEDGTLLDPASGAFNYAAPGADRLRLTCNLIKVPYGEELPNGFFQMIAIKDGIIQEKAERPQYSDIRDELARRTYDESGNYTVRGMQVRVREHLDDGENNGKYLLASGGNAELLAVGVDPGLIYVQGYDYETLVTQWLHTDKGTDYVDIQDATVTANYGNYILVDQMVGYWDVKTGAVISIYDAAEDRITLREGSSTSPGGNLIGTARVRAVVYDSGTPGTATCQWRLYLFDMQMTDDAFTEARAVYLNNASGTDAAANIVLSGGKAVVYESQFKHAVFGVPASAVRRIRDSSGNVNMLFQWYAKNDVTIATDGTFNISTSSDKPFPYQTGALNNTQKNADIIIALDTAVDTANLTGTVSINNANGDVVGSGTSFTTQLSVGDFVKVGSDVRRILTITDNTNLVVDAAFTGTSSGNAVKKSYLPGHIINMSTFGASGTNRTVVINSSTSATFDLKETLGSTVTAKVIVKLNKVDQQEKKKIIRRNRLVQIRCSTHPNTTVGPYPLGFSDVYQINSIRQKSGAFTSVTEGTDVTSQFDFDNGQRDSHYDIARILKKTASLSSGDYLLVDLDYWSHDTSTGDGYFSINSYPIDDVHAANTSAISTKEIPRFVSPTTGGTFDLRDSIDCRPRITDTASDATSIGSASLNPAVGSALNTTTNGIMTPVANEEFNFDLSYYLPRKDIVIVDALGKFRIVRGISALLPITPATPSQSMVLGVLTIPPYPSLTTADANAVQRPNYGVSVKNIPNKRYTMRDIGILDQRLSNLEYYMSLSLLEKDTSDMIIPDDQGLDRFKNGIIVDPFQGHKVGAVTDPDYSCSIDPKAKELRARASVGHVDMELTQSSNVYRCAKDAILTLISDDGDNFVSGEIVYQGTNLGSATATGILRHGVDNRLYVEEVVGTFVAGTAVKGVSSAASISVSAVKVPTPGNLVLLPYTHEVFAQQRFATNVRNCAGLFWSWKGHMELVPPVDMWNDTLRKPDITVNFDGNLDAWQYLAESMGTEWGSWSTRWTGSEILSSVTQSGGIRTEDFRGEWGVDGWHNVTTRTYEDWVTTATTRTTTEQVREGTRVAVVPETTTTNLGDHVVDVTLKPYMRSRQILVRVQGLKPSTRVYAFFDGENVNEFMQPISTEGWDYFSTWAPTPGQNGTTEAPVSLQALIDSSLTVPPTETGSYTVGTVTLTPPSFYDPSWVGEMGEPLVTDTDGTLLAFFNLPSTDARHFPVGTRVLRISDSVTNSSEQGQVLTSAEGQYTAQGLNVTNQSTIVSTVQASMRTETVQETQVLNSISTSTTRGSRTISETQWYDDTPDPIGQSILIRDNNAIVAGYYFTKVDLYFNTKHSNLPILVQIRPMIDPNTVSDSVVPYSEVVVYPEDIHVSEDGTKPTVVVFQNPVFLPYGENYAIVCKPIGSNPEYRMFVGEIGQKDLSTGESVISQPAVGVLFASSNDATWTAIQTEDLKFTLYRAKFDTSVTGQVTIGNRRHEYLTLSDYDANFEIGEQVRGPIVLSANTLSGSANTGEYIWGAVSNAYGEIMAANNSTKVYTLSEHEGGRTFLPNEALVFRFANNESTGASANLQAISLPVGYVDFFGTGAQNTALQLRGVSSVGFTANDTVRGQHSNAYGVVSGTVGLKMNVVQSQISQIVLTDTAIEWGVKGTTSSGHDLASAFIEMPVNVDFEFPEEMIVLSASEEDADIASARSLQFRGLMTSDKEQVSPCIDLTTTSAIVVQNIINNDATGETNPTGGNAVARYITRRVALADNQDAEDLQVYTTIWNPPETTVKIYAKFLHSEDADTFREDKNWIEMSRTSTTSFSDRNNKNDFREAKFVLPDSVKTGTNGEFQYVNSAGVTFTGYKYFAIKIVMLSTNSSIVPRLRDLRGIALQI